MKNNIDYRRQKRQREENLKGILNAIGLSILFFGIFKRNEIIMCIGIIVIVMNYLKIYLRSFKWYHNIKNKVKAIYKGKEKERFIKKVLDAYLNEEYKILNNITLETKEGDTTQIDHIVVSSYGVFVLETKNYKGEITGKDTDRDWCQNINNHMHYFMNPIHQNYKHIKTLEYITGINEAKFISVVIFPDDVILRAQTRNNVIKQHKIIQIIKSYNEKIIDDKTVDKICSIIEQQNITGFQNDIKHINNVKEKVKKKTSNQKLCSCCGAKLSYNRKLKRYYCPNKRCYGKSKNRY